MPKVLLVEDEEMNRDMLRRRLTRRGFEIIEAADGARALEVARSEAPELILLDMSLPVMSGWETVKVLKGDAATSSIPVIALTAHAMHGDRSRALEAGCDEYETKPVDLKRLIGKMTALIEG